MSIDNILAYQSQVDYPEKITSTKISKVSYLLKLKVQQNCLADLDKKHKAWGQKKIT